MNKVKAHNDPGIHIEVFFQILGFDQVLYFKDRSFVEIDLFAGDKKGIHISEILLNEGKIQ
ncbi:MAG: hypothetical protein ACRCX4_12805 [Bacteroidales bacterium]